MERAQEVEKQERTPLESPHALSESSGSRDENAKNHADEIQAGPRMYKDSRMDSGFSDDAKDGSQYQKIAF